MTKELVARWTGQRDVVAGISRGRPSSPFGTVEGRLDLRGLPLRAAGLTLKKVSLDGVDLSYADLEQVRLERCRFTDVRFDNVEARNAGDYGNVFDRCTFDRTNLAGAALGFDGSRFTACEFRRTRLTRAVFGRPEFDDCLFEDVPFQGLDFNGASFARCTFRGLVLDAWFRGGYPLPSHAKRFGKARPNRMSDVDFSGAVLRDVTFSDGCDLSTVRLPDDGSVLRFDRWQARLEAAIARTADRDIAMFLQSYRPHAQRQDQYLLAVADVAGELGEAKAAEAVALLLG